MKKYPLTTGIFIALFFLKGLSSYSQTPAPSAVSPVTAAVKHEDSNKFEYLISGLANATDAADLVTIFKNRPGIIDAVADVPNHKITVYAPMQMPESDILEVLKYAGKAVIRTPKELSKFY